MSILKNLGRWGATAALLGGAAWWGLSLESIVRPDPEEYRTALFLIPFCLSAVGIAALHARQRQHAGRLGRIGVRLTLGGMLIAVVGTFANLAGIDELLWLEFPVGALVWTVGMALLGIATVRAKVVPGWAGVALAIAEPMTVLVAVALSPLVPLQSEGAYSGALANGTAFLLLGLALRRTVDTTAIPAPGAHTAPLPA